MTLTDTGPLVSLIDEEDDGHQECLIILPKLSSPMITTWPCFTEAMYLLGDSTGYRGQEELWGYLLDKLLTLHLSTEAEAERMRVLMQKYQDAPMDLADASLVAAAETLSLLRVFTLDSHFYAYRTADKKALEVVPAFRV